MNPNLSIQPKYWIYHHYDYLLNYALARVPKNISEDLIQDTYLAGLKNLPEFRYESKERTWLTAILNHKIIDYYRSTKTKKAQTNLQALKASDIEELFGHSWETMIMDQNKTDDHLAIKELKKVIANGLSKLSPLERKVMTYTMLGHGTDEICQSLKIKRSNCWVNLSRARKKMKIFLAQNWETTELLKTT